MRRDFQCTFNLGISLPDIKRMSQPTIPTSIWQMMLSTGMLLTCGTIIQHAFRGIMFPYKSNRIVTYVSTTEKFATKMTRTIYFGAFSWLISLIIGVIVDQVSSWLGGTRLMQHVSSLVGSSASEGYAFVANAILILLTTPVMCLIGSYLRRRSGREYTERMKLSVKSDRRTTV